MSTLPYHPTFEHLRHQAKDLHYAELVEVRAVGYRRSSETSGTRDRMLHAIEGR